eukprot:6799925-Pyramimonas_sp.AAC.1
MGAPTTTYDAMQRMTNARRLLPRGSGSVGLQTTTPITQAVIVRGDGKCCRHRPQSGPRCVLCNNQAKC